MSVEARTSSIWNKQKLFIAIFFLAMSGWFFLDGAIRYPASNVRWTAHQAYKSEGRLQEWPKYAKDKGWVTEPPHREYTKSDIVTQYVFGSLAAVGGLLIFVYWLTQKQRTMRMDDEAVYTPSGTRVPFTSLKVVDKKKWDSKGIAKVRYEDNGRLRQFIVDDYKFETEPARQILTEIENRLTASRTDATRDLAAS